MRDFSDKDQRLAFCFSQWEGEKSKEQKRAPGSMGYDVDEFPFRKTTKKLLSLILKEGNIVFDDEDTTKRLLRLVLESPGETVEKSGDEDLEEFEFELRGEITKLEDEQQIAYGWFSVIEEDGIIVEDVEGDVISEKSITKAAHSILDSRAGKLMHKGEAVADIVESIVFTHDLQKALGIDLKKVGWFGGMKFHDDDVWADVKSGKFPAFSIGGTGQRKAI